MTDKKKIDRRVRYTKRAIRESFLELLDEKPIEKISVTEICKGADINRGTFYSHYADPFALKKELEQELVDALADAAEKQPTGRLTASQALQALKDNKDLCRLFCGPNGDMGAMITIISSHSEGYYKELMPELEAVQEKNLECLRAMLCAAGSALIRYWYENNMQDDCDYVAECMDLFCCGGVKNFCDNVEKLT